MEAGAIVRWEGGGAGWLSPSLCRRERDEKEELPLEFSLRILLNPRMLSCSLNLLQSQIDGAASIAALLRSVKNAGWVVGEQNFLHTQERGKQHVSPEVHFAVTDWGSVSLALRT